MKKIIYLLILLNFSNLTLLGQDMQYSQYYASPLYLNPAFTGSSLAPRFSANYRVQWPNADINPTGTVFGGDFYLENWNSGIGLLINHSSYNSIIKNTELGLLYSYNLQLGEETFLRMGVQGSYVNRAVNFDNLLFPDQIDSNSPTQEKAKYPPSRFVDVSSGILVYGTKYWFGLATHHLNRPNQSLINRDTEFGKLPIKLSLHGGFNIIFDEFVRKGQTPLKFLTPTFNYRRQAKFEQLDIGSYMTLSPIVFGLWYRGVPIKKDVNNQLKNESLGMILGYRQENISIGYSYDMTVSRIKPTGGAHEITVVYRFEPIETRLHRRRWGMPVAVPEF
jgi:type IX secretion system PorP/SprF family membrane protein